MLSLQGIIIAQSSVGTDLLQDALLDSIPNKVVITGDQISNLPVRGFNEYLELNSFISFQDGELHIRGGGVNENSYFINGFNLTNPFGFPGIYIIPESINEINVMPGYFSAAYNSTGTALVSTTLKTGSSNFNTAFNFQTDKFASAGKKYLGGYSYREHIFTGVAQGSVLDKHHYFVAVENHDIGDTQKRFSKGFDFNNLTEVYPETVNPEIISSLSYPDGFTPGNSRNRWAVNSIFSFNFNPFKIELTGLYDWSKFYDDRTPMLTILNDRDFFTIKETAFLGANFIYDFKQKSQLNVRFGYYILNSEKNDDYFGNDWQKWADSSEVARVSNGHVGFEDAWNIEDYILNGFPFEPPGDYENYEKTKHTWIESGISFKSQFSQNHRVNIGFDMRQFSFRQYSIDPSIMAYTDPDNYYQNYPSAKDIPEDIYRKYTGNIFGYDFMGNEKESKSEGPKEPLFAGSFLDYQFKYKNFSLNGSLRYNYFDTKIEAGEITDILSGLKWDELKPLTSWDPRFSLKYFWNRNTSFYVNYGINTKSPLNYVSYANDYKQVIIGGFYYLVPFFGTIKEPTQFSFFELGLIKSFSDFGLLQSTFYMKKQKNNKQPEPSSNYFTIIGGDLNASDIMGFDISYSYRGLKHLTSKVQYSYLNTETREDVKTDYQNEHKILANLEYRFPERDGGSIFENSGINIVYKYSSGHPFTKVYVPPGGRIDPYNAGVDYMNDTRSRQALEPENSSTTPWRSYLDLKIDKSITIWNRMKATFYIRINNLFNTKNVLNVYPRTGSAEDDGFISDPEYSGAFVNHLGSGYLEWYKAINITNGQAYWSEVGKELYGHPRQIFFGVKFEY